MIRIYDRHGVYRETISREEAERREQDRVRSLPDYVLKYLAPMACGSLERAELVRRYKQGETR